MLRAGLKTMLSYIVCYSGT